MCKFTVSCREEETPCLAHPPLASQCVDHASSVRGQHCNCFSAGERDRLPTLNRRSKQIKPPRAALVHSVSPWPHFAKSLASTLALEWRLRLECCGDDARERYMVTSTPGRAVGRLLTQWMYFSHLSKGI